jgi:ketosteroid isomerase-like protein
MTLDDAIKEKYCNIYRGFTKSFSSGAIPDWHKAGEEAARYVADDVVWIHPAPLPKMEGKKAIIAMGTDFASVLTIVHGIQAIWCTDDGWVHVILNEAWTAYNADKSKIVAGLEPRMGRVHINDEGKIDQIYYYWDTTKVLPKLMSTADDNA